MKLPCLNISIGRIWFPLVPRSWGFNENIHARVAISDADEFQNYPPEHKPIWKVLLERVVSPWVCCIWQPPFKKIFREWKKILS